MNIGIVLSGGMAKGAYQIGALRALREFIPMDEIKYMSCASVGVLNGYAFATDNLDRAEEMWHHICSNDTRLLINQILRSSMLQRNIINLYDPQRKLFCPFYCSLLDINHRNVIYKDLSQVNSDQIPQYLKASVAMPIYNRSVPLDNTAYFDGAMIDNIPVFPLLKADLDYIICIYFDDTCYKFENIDFDNKVIKITFPCDTVLKQSLVFQQDSIAKMIESGYSRTRSLLRMVLSEGHDNLEHIYGAIGYLNRNSMNNGFRITGDVLVTNLNRITQKLTHRKIL